MPLLWCGVCGVTMLPATLMLMLEGLNTILMMVFLVYEYALYSGRNQIIDACRWAVVLIIPLIPLVAVLDALSQICGLTI